MSDKNNYQPILSANESLAEQFLQLLPLARIIMALGPSPDSNLKDFDEFEWVVRKAAKLAEDVERMGDK